MCGLKLRIRIFMNQWIKISFFIFLNIFISPSLYADSPSNPALQYFQSKAVSQQLPIAKTAVKNKDYAKALDIYKHFADQNVPVAEYQLGYLYLNGFGVEKNNDIAAAWFTKSAEHAYAPGQF